jgi:YHS domain-containing protein
MKNLLCLFAVTLLFAAAGCSRGSTPRPQEKSTAAENRTSSFAQEFIPPINTYSSVTQCPVTKNNFTIGKDTRGVRYKDKDYYFCCPSCVSEFKKNPDKYIRY